MNLRTLNIKSLYFPVAYTLLVNEFGPEAIADCCSISKGSIEDLIGKESPKGTKGKNIAATMERLDKAGGMTTKPQQRLERGKYDNSNEGQGTAGNLVGDGGSAGDRALDELAEECRA